MALFSNHVTGYSNPFDALPNEMYFEIFRNVDLPSIHAARVVSHKWKVIMESARDLKYKVCLSDLSTNAAIKSEKKFIDTISIQNLEGKLPVVSSTRGVGRILGETKKVEVIGRKIDPEQLKRVMRYTLEAVEEVSFEECRPDAIQAVVLGFTKPFTALTKLTFSFNSFPTPESTTFFKRWANSDAAKLPMLRELHISYSLEATSLREAVNLKVPIQMDMHDNYLSMWEVILLHRGSLRTLEIRRSPLFRCLFQIRQEETPLENTYIPTVFTINRILRQLHKFLSFQLEVYQVETFHLEGDILWCFESITSGLSTLGEVEFNGRYSPPMQRQQFPPGLCSDEDRSKALTSFKFEVYTDAHILNLEETLGHPKELEELWLVVVNSVVLNAPVWQSTLVLENLVQTLPISLTSLHFTASSSFKTNHHQVLSKGQITWIIRNLINLTDFWLQLVVGDWTEEEYQRHANVDVPLFRELVMMRKLKELRCEMIPARMFEMTYEADNSTAVGVKIASELPLEVKREDFLSLLNVTGEPGVGMKIQTESHLDLMPLPRMEFYFGC